MAGEACEDCNGRGWIDLPGGHYETPCKRCNGRVAEIVEENNRFEAEIATLRARVAELKAALIQCRGALRLDAMVDEDGQPYGTTEVALEAVRCALGEPDTPNMFRRSVNESPGGEHER